jgi:low affinity Fe/Cu permease
MTGRPPTFALAVSIIVIWGVTGPLYHYSDTWQLVINTSTTIVTFLMVFLIQNTQNRDAEAIQVKLDELIRATHGCHNALLDLEELEDEELDRIRTVYGDLAERARQAMRGGRTDTGVPEVFLEAGGRKTPSPQSRQRRPASEPDGVERDPLSESKGASDGESRTGGTTSPERK